jgi:hypothetical protein
MAAFTRTARGFLNLDVVGEGIERSGGKFDLLVHGQTLDDKNAYFEKAITSIVASEGAWEVIIPVEPDPDGPRYVVEPILAWGLTVAGHLLPITASEPEGVDGQFVVRQHGRARVYGVGNVGGWNDVDHWSSMFPRT